MTTTQKLQCLMEKILHIGRIDWKVLFQVMISIYGMWYFMVTNIQWMQKETRSILLSAISKMEYEKITNKDTAHDIFESLRMSHEGNAQVKETKALALIQKYEEFNMEEGESIEAMFSRFQTLTAGLRVLDKGYTKADHVKKDHQKF